MFFNECLACLQLFRVHGIGFGHFRNEGLLQFYSMIERSLRGKFSSLRLVEDLGVLGILWRELLFYLSGSLSQGSRKSELSNMRVALSQDSTKSCFISLLSIDPGSKLGVVSFHGMEVS